MLAITDQRPTPNTPGYDPEAPYDPTEARRQRGLAIAARCKIKNVGNGFYSVPSQNSSDKYLVTLKPQFPDIPLCECPDFEKRGEPCKHVFAVQFVVERESHPDGSETVKKTLTVTETKTTAPRKTYPQDWKSYNRAQTTEKNRFLDILNDLCDGIQEPARKPGPGRKPIPLRDAVFSAVFKVFSAVSSRRFMCDLEAACTKGYISKTPHFNATSNALEDPSITPILRAMIVRSSLPLKAVEIDFAVDSTGFTTCRFVRWFDEKYGKPRMAADWVKAHLMTGVKTHVVTAVEIEERHAADCPQFIPLMKTTTKNFKPKEVAADAAYLSYENMDAVAANGAMPYFCFKVNTTAGFGGTMAKMFHLFNLNRDDYLKHYHKRSNIESTNSMIKAKFGDSIRSKTDVAMTNEVYAKILCHNICCLIQAACELGITATFWSDEPEAQGEPAPNPFDTEGDAIAAIEWM